MRIKSPKILAILGVAAASLGLSLWLGPHIITGLAGAAGWLRGIGLRGDLLFIGFELVVTLAGIVPGALLGAAAGAIFGVVGGFWVSALGIMAGALAAFALSRSFLRPVITHALGQRGRLQALDGALTQDGWRLVALLRISPVMPFSITSYALGLSNIRPREYVLGTLASLPPLLGYVVLGTLGGASLGARSALGRNIHLLLFGLGAAATLALTLYLARLMARALRATSVSPNI